MCVRHFVVHVDHADHVAAADERNRKKGFVGVLNQTRESLEPFVGRGFRSQGHDGLMLGHPSSDAFAWMHPEIPDFAGVREL